jgi:hypothetical protein
MWSVFRLIRFVCELIRISTAVMDFPVPRTVEMDFRVYLLVFEYSAISAARVHNGKLGLQVTKTMYLVHFLINLISDAQDNLPGMPRTAKIVSAIHQLSSNV